MSMALKKEVLVWLDWLKKKTLLKYNFNKVSHDKASETQKTSQFINCLEPLLQALYWPGERRHLLDALPYGMDKLDLNGFLDILHSLKFHHKSISVKLSLLNPHLMPCLFLTRDNRVFVVLEKVEHGTKVLDGLSGKVIILTQENQIDGVAYVFHREKPSTIKPDENWFHHILYRFRSSFYHAFIITLFLNIFSLAVPLFVMAIYDQVVSSGSLSLLLGFGIGVGIAIIATSILYFIQTRVIIDTGAKLNNVIGNGIFERLLYLAPGYTESAPVSSQILRIKDFDNIREFFVSPLMILLFELPFTLLFLLVIGLLGGFLALIPLLMVAVFALVFSLIRPSARKSVEHTAHANANLQNFLLESLKQMHSIKYTASEQTWLRRYQQLSAETSFTNYHAMLMNTKINVTADFLMVVGGVLVLLAGTIQVMNNIMSVGALIAVMMLTWRLMAPLKLFFASEIRFRQMRSSVHQLNVLMRIIPEREPDVIVNSMKTFNGDIHFNRVTLRYQPDLDPALSGIGFAVKNGEVVAIVGRNGSGKSTLLKLLLGLYKPQAGNITINGHDIRQIDPIELRHAIAYVPQHCQIFSGTIAENLRLVNSTSTDEELVEAAECAGLLEEIRNLPAGFNTDLKEYQIHLSNSFFQRLSLARAYLKKSPLALFDEPLNGLDASAERSFVKIIDKLRKHSTIFLISHKPAHLILADRIVLLHEGQVILSGPASAVLPRMPKEFL